LTRMNKIRNARRLKATFKGECDEGRLYEVESGDNLYSVLVTDSTIKCNCPDYEYRWFKAEASFVCKHCWAVLMEIAQRGGGW